MNTITGTIIGAILGGILGLLIGSSWQHDYDKNKYVLATKAIDNFFREVQPTFQTNKDNTVTFSGYFYKVK